MCALGQTEAAVQGEPVAQGMEGELWEGVGNIVALDDYGFDFTTASGETVYIELGPPDYWQTPGCRIDRRATGRGIWQHQRWHSPRGNSDTCRWAGINATNRNRPTHVERRGQQQPRPKRPE